MRLTPIRDIRRDELIKAAFEIIKRDGLRAATIGNIAEAAGASKGIVHHYFEDKQDLSSKRCAMPIACGELTW